ncbi:ABC transporter substrate-binding protein [Devosia rhodophyticola]|uniref:ABC transporter substrate-binding protein n=1 Tax=Devosia rhodophyticola TaxID=3026423 RepID=A0ABY7YW49_9HYPH|nr:ABC transporter substrate-binding protein [Devosia rhodophyticola]WDR05534.1 ABC transporter substrate-binding protein [Devosia rhodophyticola]
MKRRDLLKTSAALAILAAVPTLARGADTTGAPSLDADVTAGNLPAAAERVGEEPLVLEPVESVGQYGGTIRDISNEDLGMERMVQAVEPFAKFNRDANGFRPNVLKAWNWNDAYTEVTMRFRKGMKWSDGQPFGPDDFMFFWNDMVLEEDVGLSFPSGTVVNNKPMTVEKLDDLTIKLTFDGPNPLFIDFASRGHYQSAQWLVPAHYMKQFHPKYSDAADTQDLMARYNTASRTQQLDMPTLNAWLATSYTAGQRLVTKRNPYYWKVDTKGQQLPYVDGFDTTLATADSFKQAVLLNTVAGKIDFQARDFNLGDISLLLQNQEKGEYKVKMWQRGDYAWPWIILMYDFNDEGIVDLFYKQEFRKALSFAMDRNKYNQIGAYGLAKPRQFALSPESPEFQSPEGQTFYEKWSTSYIDHDAEGAKKLLDAIGVVDKDGDGFRERPDGTRLQLIIDMPTDDPETNSIMDLMKEDWDGIGIETILNPIAGSEMTVRAQNREMMIRSWPSASGWGLLSAATVWAPIEGVEWCVGGINLGRYYQSGGTEGTAPRPGSMLEKLQKAYGDAVAIVDPAERDKALLAAYEIHLDEGPVSLGTIGEHPSPVVVSNRLHNVQDTGLLGGWDLGYPGTADPEQFYFSS